MATKDEQKTREWRGYGAKPAQWLSAIPLLARRMLCAAYAVLIAGLSLAPGSSFDFLPPLFPGEDKLGHVLMYALLAWLLLWAASPAPGRRTWHRLIISVVLCFAYGALLEVAQEFFRPNDRQFSVGDMAANAVGAVLAATTWLIIFPIRRGTHTT